MYRRMHATALRALVSWNVMQWGEASRTNLSQ